MISNQLRYKLASVFPPAHVLRGKRNMKTLVNSMPYSDDIIAGAIESGEPKLIGRLGGTEARVLGCHFDIFRGKSLWDPFSTVFSILMYKKRLRQLRNGAGVYPISRRVTQSFVAEQLEALRAVDVLGTWGTTFTWVEKYPLKNPEVRSVSHHSVAPWVEIFEWGPKSLKTWASSLSGKKILVISGFSQSFKSQHERIKKVFPENIYPSFHAEFITAPISQGGINDGRTWVDHLERMKNEMESIDFEVALISAGAYALPLAYHAKKLGKIGITCGGELQLFFGVIGKRWEHMEKVTKYQNEYWVRPSESERPENWREIENGCYW
jgi:hypothetical protein